MLLQEISQILITIGNISASQEEQILIEIKNIFASQEAIEEKRIHEKLPQEEISRSFF
jgi:hypothetical protein